MRTVIYGWLPNGCVVMATMSALWFDHGSNPVLAVSLGAISAFMAIWVIFK